ncbi:hypothetical protein J1N35_038227 [Gossypium stocksii]|uniref:DUF4283 domain-containing protein n=1 Tax=Gossypium stocksii TaxID=47602 RepID=A0A9D3ULC4_9ROSI|nr:hypothetical protein J1N35_038227 [Gossypium stocksii]
MIAVNPSCSEAAMEVKTVKLISEEKEELLKSIKKRDTLAGEDFCNFEAYLEKEPVSMEEFDDCLNEPVLENIKDGIISITLSSDEKDRIRLKWDRILIIKLWNLSGELQLIDLDSGFFVVQFSCFDDFEKVLKGGPWFVNGHFVTMRRWNPKFRALRENCPIILAQSRDATCSKVAATVETNHTFTAPVTLACAHPMDMSTFSPSPANVSTVQHPIVEPADSGTWLIVPRKSRARKPFIEAALKSPTAAATFSADKAGPGSAEPAGSAAVKAAESQKVSRC